MVSSGMNATTTADAKIAFANEHWAAGRTVYVATALRVTVLSAKASRASALPLLKVGKDGSLLLLERWSRGCPVYVDADYCRLSAR